MELTKQHPGSDSSPGAIPSEQGTEDSAENAGGIVFFDGVCGFCNHSVNFLMARDVRRRLRFAPLQGQTAARLLPAGKRESLSSLIYLHQGTMFVRSAAVVRILRTLGGRWWWAGQALWLIPLPLRDLGYRLIARVRYRLFGKHESCRLPQPEERALFLD